MYSICGTGHLNHTCHELALWLKICGAPKEVWKRNNQSFISSTSQVTYWATLPKNFRKKKWQVEQGPLGIEIFRGYTVYRIPDEKTGKKNIFWIIFSCEFFLYFFKSLNPSPSSFYQNAMWTMKRIDRAGMEDFDCSLDDRFQKYRESQRKRLLCSRFVSSRWSESRPNLTHAATFAGWFCEK